VIAMPLKKRRKTDNHIVKIEKVSKIDEVLSDKAKKLDRQLAIADYRYIKKLLQKHEDDPGYIG
jgi:hypothetical protein